jgi:TRAP-type C4-dicarboxylate transport system permease small subunit
MYYYIIIFCIILLFFSWKTFSLFSFKKEPIELENIDRDIILLLNGDEHLQ